MYAYVWLWKSIYLMWTYKSDKRPGGTSASTALRFLPEPIKNGTRDGVYIATESLRSGLIGLITNAVERNRFDARLAQVSFYNQHHSLPKDCYRHNDARDRRAITYDVGTHCRPAQGAASRAGPYARGRVVRGVGDRGGR